MKLRGIKNPVSAGGFDLFIMTLLTPIKRLRTMQNLITSRVYHQVDNSTSEQKQANRLNKDWRLQYSSLLDTCTAYLVRRTYSGNSRTGSAFFMRQSLVSLLKREQ